MDTLVFDVGAAFDDEGDTMHADEGIDLVRTQQTGVNERVDGEARGKDSEEAILGWALALLLTSTLVAILSVGYAAATHRRTRINSQVVTLDAQDLEDDGSDHEADTRKPVRTAALGDSDVEEEQVKL